MSPPPIMPQRLSDDHLRETVLERLRSDDQIETANIEVSVQDSEVTLTGIANGRWSRMRAEEIARTVDRVRGVRNLLRTDHEPRTAPGQVAEGGTDSPK